MGSIDEASDEEKRARDALTHEAWGAGLGLYTPKGAPPLDLDAPPEPSP